MATHHHRKMVLMVAEKPSIASSIAHILGGSDVNTRKGISPMCPVDEFNGSFRGGSAFFRVTSVAGHVYGTG